MEYELLLNITAEQQRRHRAIRQLFQDDDDLTDDDFENIDELFSEIVNATFNENLLKYIYFTEPAEDNQEQEEFIDLEDLEELEDSEENDDYLDFTYLNEVEPLLRLLIKDELNRRRY